MTEHTFPSHHRTHRRARHAVPRFVSALAAAVTLALAGAATAQADGPIANPFFTTGLSGWEFSGTVPQDYLLDEGTWVTVEPGAPVALAGTAGSPQPPQNSLLGAGGTPGKSYRYKTSATDSNGNIAIVFGSRISGENPGGTSALWQFF